MKTFKKIILFAFIGVIFVTCKKETLTPSATVGQPVFSFMGTIGSTSLNWQAGVNNYYMFSTFKQDSAGVYNFTGTLQNTGTPNNSIQITINDDTAVGNGAPSNINKSVSPTTYYLYNIPNGNSIEYSVSFMPLNYSGTPLNYTYNFGDGTTSTSKNPVHSYKILSSKTTYITSLSVGFSTYPILESISNPVTILKQASSQPTVDSINYKLLTPDSGHSHPVSITAYINNGSAPYTYLWYYGDHHPSNISTSTSATVTTTYTYTGTAKQYTVTIALLGASLNDSIAIYNCYLIDTVSANSRMDYYLSPPKPVPNPSALSNVTVNYTDGSGNKYTSNNALQPTISTFQVTSVSNYQKNMYNNQTKMLNVTFNCMLYPVNNSSLYPIQATNCTAIIAVAYQ